MISLYHIKSRICSAVASAIAVASVGQAIAQDPVPAPAPKRDVRVDNDALKARSASQNIVFGQLVDVDEHRLTLQETGAETRTSLRISPDSRVLIDDKPVRITDIPPNSRLKVYLREDDDAVLDRIVVVNDDDRAAARTVRDSTSPVGFGIILEDGDALIVADVRVGGPADTVGIRAGDELLALNGETLTTPDDLFKQASQLEAGRAATLRIVRDGTARDLKVIVDKGAPARDGVQVAARTPPTNVIDAEDKPEVDTRVTPEVNLGATLGTATDGVAVVRLEKNSPLARAGLKDGDMIKQVAGRNVLTPDSIFRVLNELEGGSKVEVVVLRNEEELTFSQTLPEDHERVLVDGAEPAPALGTDDTVRGTNQTHLAQRVRELEQANLQQQRQIQFLYNALVDTRNQLGYPALSTAVPGLFGLPAAVDGTTGDGAGVNDGTDGTGANGTEAGTVPQQERTRRRRSIDIDQPPDPPTVPFPRRR
jgi:hypothetical protein